MKITTCLFAALLGMTLVFSSCGGKKKGESDTETIDANNPLSIVKNAEKISENMKDQQEEGAKRIEQRRAKGDTMPIPYKDLEKYLPATVAGYEKDGDPKGSTENMQTYHHSSATQRFKK